jgi:hypothetical protein
MNNNFPKDKPPGQRLQMLINYIEEVFIEVRVSSCSSSFHVDHERHGRFFELKKHPRTTPQGFQIPTTNRIQSYREPVPDLRSAISQK